MGNMKEIGLLDCEDRPSIEENFARIKESCDGPVLDENGKLLNEVLPEGYPYEERKFYYDNSGYKDGDDLIGDFFYKVSDDVIPYEDIIGAELGYSGTKLVVDESLVRYVEGEYCCLDKAAFVTYKDNVIVNFSDSEFNVPTAGLYMPPDKLTNGSTSITKTTVVPMAEEYIPDSLKQPSNLSETDSTSKAYVDGVLQPRHLPEGYPYEERIVNRTAIVEETVLTGTTNGSEWVYFDAPVTQMIETGKTYEVTIDGKTYSAECGETFVPDQMVPYIESDIFSVQRYDANTVQVAVSTTEPADVSVSISFSLYEVEEQTTIVPMAEKFLPPGIGGGGSNFVVHFIGSEGEYTLDATVDEIIDAILDGKNVVVVDDNVEGTQPRVYHLTRYSLDTADSGKEAHFIYVGMMNGYIYLATIYITETETCFYEGRTTYNTD